jgi:hypothetical protein
LRRVSLVLALTLLAWGAVAQAGPASQDEFTSETIAAEEAPLGAVEGGDATSAEAQAEPQAAPALEAEAAGETVAPEEAQAEPTSEGEVVGKIIATTEGPPVYVVRSGDTLWDISERFFDTPWVWPKLWEQNSFLANPHVLSPGQELKLYQGLLLAPKPALEPAPVTPEPAEAAPVAPEPPPPAIKLGTFRPSLENVGYLSPDKAEVVGIIFEAQDPLRLMIGGGDTVFLRFRGPAPAVGDLFRVVHISEDKVRHPVTGDSMGYRHTFPGVLRIIEVQGDVATACIIESYDQMAVGDGFVPWFPMPEAVALSKGGPTVEGRLIAAQSDWDRLIGQGNLVFLDVGSGDGVEPGRILGVWRTLVVPNGFPMSSEFKATRLGEAVVVLVLPDTSTALITGSDTEMAPGDLVLPEP